MSNVITAHDLFLCAVNDTRIHVLDVVVAVCWTPGSSHADYLTARRGFLYRRELEGYDWVVMHNAELIEFDLASPADSNAIVWSILPDVARAEDEQTS